MSQLRASVNYSKNKEALTTSVRSIKFRNSIKTLTVEKCPLVNETITLLSQEWFQETVFKSCPSLVAMRMKTKELNITPPEWKPRFAKLSEKARLLITLESMKGNQCVSYWRNYDSQDFLMLNLTDKSINKDVIDYTVDFIVEALQKENGSVTSVNSNVMSLASLKSSSGWNLLFAAVKEKKFAMVQHLLKQPFDVNEDFYVNEPGTNGEKIPCNKRLIDFALETKNDEISQALLKAGSTYPKGLNIKRASKEIKNFLTMSETLHGHIKTGKIEEIKKILADNKDQCYFFDRKNVSAVHKAVECKNVEIFQLLIEHNLTFGPNEDFKGDLPKELGKALCKINTEKAQKLPHRHILQLLSKSIVPRHNKGPNQVRSFVEKSFMTLDAIPLIRPILHVVSLNRRTKIHFEFMQWSVVFMNPTKCPFTRGVAIASNKHIHIAAKGLLYDHSRCEAEVTMIHEFDHSALDDTFRNERIPYGKDDIKNKQKWEKVMEDCMKNKDSDEIVKSVFNESCYEQKARGRELAVCAPRMIVHYQKNEKELKKQKEVFKSLFDYHKDVVVPAMMAAIPVLENLASECEIRYNELTEPLKAALRHAQVKFQDESLKLGEIANPDVLEKLTSQEIRDTLDGTVLEIAAEEKVEEKVQIYIERSFIKWNENDKRNNALNSQQLCEQVSRSKVLLFADIAGAGKSTTMRHLREELKKKYPHSWVSYIDLKRYTSIYSKTSEKLNVSKTIEKILAIENDSLSSFVFAHLFNSNRMILLLDGVDEIAPKYKEFFMKFVERIKSETENQLWIATRPQHAPELSKLLKCDTYKLLPLSQCDAKNLIEAALRAEDIVDKNTLRSSFAACWIFIYFDENKNKNPLMLQMLAQLAAGERLSTITFKRCDVYEQMIELKRDIVANKKSEIISRDLINNSRISIDEVHMVYALKLLFPDGEVARVIRLTKSEDTNVSIESLELFELFEDEKSKWSTLKISRLGLLLVNEWDTPKETPDFVHRTFAEFFAVKFVAESVHDVTKKWKRGKLSETQFYAEMEILLNISYSLIKYSEPTIYFFGNYLRRLRYKILPCRDIFTKLIERTDVIEFLIKSANPFFIIEIAGLFGHSEKYLTEISKFGKEPQTLFQRCVRKKHLYYSLHLFDAFRCSQLPNWHRFTGYGLDLESSQLILASATELKQLAKDLEKDAKLWRMIDDRSDESVLLTYHFLCFVENLDEFPTDDSANLKMFLINIVFCVATMRSRMVVDKIFSIIRKHWGESKCASVSEILDCLLTRFSCFLNANRNIFHSTIVENIVYMITKYVVYLEPDAETNKELEDLANSVKKLFFVSVLYDYKCLETFCRRFVKPEEILHIFLEDFPMFAYAFSTPEEIERLDKFVAETSQGEIKTILQLVLVHSEDLSDHLRLCETLMRLSNDNWLDHVGYSAKEATDIASLSTADQIKKLAATEKNDDYIENRIVAALCHFLNALRPRVISKEDFEKIRENLGKEQGTRIFAKACLDRLLG